MYSSHVTDEAPEDALVGEWCEQHGKSTVPERKPGADRNNRTVYGWSGLYDADAGSGKVPECGKSAEEGRKGESLRRHHMPLLDAMQTAARKAFREAFV